MSPLPSDLRARLLGYAVAFGAVAVATLLDLAFLPLIAPSVTPAFFLAVALAAFYGGALPGIAATAGSILVLTQWLFDAAPLTATPSPGLRTAIFLVVAGGLTWIGGIAHRRRALAVDRAEENRLLREQAETALREAEIQSAAARTGVEASARLAAIVTSSGDAIVGKTLDGVVTSWNAAAERIFGYTAAEMIGTSIFRLIPEEQHQSERDLLQRLRRGEVVEFMETERIRKDGARVLINLSVSPVRDASGELVGAASIKRDVTDYRRAEAELRRQAEQLRLAHEAARLGTWHWDVASNTLSWDEGLRRLYGLTPDQQVTGYDDFISRVHPEDRDRVGEAVQRALAGKGMLDYEFRIVLPDGQVRWLADLGRVTADADGHTLMLTGICMDVTERKAMQDHLRDAQRLQATGQLAGGIAHEANNQMSVVLGAAHFLLRRADLPDPVRQDVELIQQAAARTASITQQLLAFSRRQLLRLEPVDLNATLAAAEPLLRRTLAENQQLVVRRGSVPGLIRADPRQLEQVLLNLTLNARDAMPDGGTVTIETGPDHDGPLPGETAVITVRDTGRGMDRATLRRVFEPFFTTKQVGQGTGLGLSVVHGIVGQTGGEIRVESEPGAGTTFRIFLPVALPDAGLPGPAAAAEVAIAAAGTVVLIVEDDEGVRRMAARALSEAGYATLEAADGGAAMELIRQHSGRLDLVVTDIGMPVMDGYELARQLGRERPGLPVLYISGYVDEDLGTKDAPRPDWPLLRKPFPPAELVRRAAALLEAGAVPAGNRSEPDGVSTG